MISFTKSLLLQTTALLLLPIAVAAQYGSTRVSFALYVGSGAKAGLIQSPRMRYQPWGEVNVGMSIGVTGAAENSATARLHIQHSRDDIRHRVGRQESYTIESLSLLVNPEVSIPLRNRYRESKIDLIAGIGADILLEQWMSMRNVIGYYAGTALNATSDSINAVRNKIIPYATLGIAFKFHRRSSLVVRIRQDARNLFEKGSQITLDTGSGEQTVNLSAQPTRVLIGCQITLGKLPEVY